MYKLIETNIKLVFRVFVSEYRRQVGKGRVGHGIDHYLLDNRNRTQKWDE